MYRLALTALCAFAVFTTIAIGVDEFGGGGRPWFGWWDSSIAVAGPYTLAITPRAGGAAARAGLRAGDRIDLRAQSVTSRIAVTYQLMATQRTDLIVARGNTVRVARIVGSTIWDNATVWKLQPFVSRLLANLLFIGCSAFIALHLRRRLDTRVVPIVFLCLVGTMLDPSFLVVPSPSLALALLFLSRTFAAMTAAVWIWLASRSRASRTQRPLATLAFAAVVVAFAMDLAAIVGLSTARIDPLPFILSISPWRSSADIAVWLLVLLYTISSARHLIPLPAGLFVAALCFASPAFIHYWFANIAVVGAANIAVPLGVVFVTYTLARRYSGTASDSGRTDSASSAASPA